MSVDITHGKILSHTNFSCRFLIYSISLSMFMIDPYPTASLSVFRLDCFFMKTVVMEA